MKTKHGKKFERFLSDAAMGLTGKYPVTWERILDSASAGGLVRVSESDFRLTVKADPPGCSRVYLLECKASIVSESLACCFRKTIKSGQLAKMRLAMRAGATGVYLFLPIPSPIVEVWKVDEAFITAYYTPRAKLPSGPTRTVHSGDLRKFLCELCEGETL